MLITLVRSLWTAPSVAVLRLQTESPRRFIPDSMNLCSITTIYDLSVWIFSFSSLRYWRTASNYFLLISPNSLLTSQRSDNFRLTLNYLQPWYNFYYKCLLLIASSSLSILRNIWQVTFLAVRVQNISYCTLITVLGTFSRRIKYYLLTTGRSLSMFFKTVIYFNEWKRTYLSSSMSLLA